jgi:membrane dipeptidase
MTTLNKNFQHLSKSFPLCDMLGINLTHPRFSIDHIDLGILDETTCRGDFVKFANWGMRVVTCKAGPVIFDDNFSYLWPKQPEHRPGRPNPEPLYLSHNFKNPTQVVLALLDRFLCDVEENSQLVKIIKSKSDLDAKVHPQKVGILLGSNRCDWFGDSPGILRMFARLGLRMITLSVSGRDPGWDGHDVVVGSGGLNKLGLRLIQEMNSCGILIDLAHTNENSALDIIENSCVPVVDTHSNPRALEDNTRNTTDEVMKKLAARGGLLGITPAIERPHGEKPYKSIPQDQLDNVMKNINYAVNIMGIDSVGIGTHFNTACLPWVIDRILAEGYRKNDVYKITGGNFLRVLNNVLPQ